MNNYIIMNTIDELEDIDLHSEEDIDLHSEQNDNLNAYDMLINKYIEYYRKTYPDNQVKNMFDNVNYGDLSSTNHIMEMFYTDLLKYKKINNDIYVDASEVDFENIDELFGLKVDGEIRYVSQSVISLLHDVVNKKYNDWFIINLK
jgi:hypothetical protein